jgi:lipopolysaccharide/colanic/teichoic acid biosynthesis glycosyltransferase
MKLNESGDGVIFTMKNDPRITPVGRFLRKSSMDELPQLLNVLLGDMSLVGPRPEVKKYVDLYTEEQRRVLSVRPGITDYASIEYVDENEILGKAEDPDRVYVEEIMPAKIKLNMRYIENRNLNEYFKIIGLTFINILR